MAAKYEGERVKGGRAASRPVTADEQSWLEIKAIYRQWMDGWKKTENLGNTLRASGGQPDLKE